MEVLLIFHLQYSRLRRACGCYPTTNLSLSFVGMWTIGPVVQTVMLSRIISAIKNTCLPSSSTGWWHFERKVMWMECYRGKSSLTQLPAVVSSYCVEIVLMCVRIIAQWFWEVELYFHFKITLDNVCVVQWRFFSTLEVVQYLGIHHQYSGGITWVQWWWFSTEKG